MHITSWRHLPTPHDKYTSLCLLQSSTDDFTHNFREYVTGARKTLQLLQYRRKKPWSIWVKVPQECAWIYVTAKKRGTTKRSTYFIGYTALYVYGMESFIVGVNCVFAYNIYVLDVIRLTENIGQYHSRLMRASPQRRGQLVWNKRVNFNTGIHTRCVMAQGNTETDKYTAFALTILIAKCRVQTGHVLILAVMIIARNWFTSGWATLPSDDRNVVIMDTLCAVVNQLPRWNWHRCKHPLITLIPGPLVLPFIHTLRHAPRHAGTYAGKHACLNTCTQVRKHVGIRILNCFDHRPHSFQVTGARCTEVAARQSWAEYSSRPTTDSRH